MTQDANGCSAPSLGSISARLTPYYERDGITIYHGDCREILPLLEIPDLLLTDPPYGISLTDHDTAFSRRTKPREIVGDESQDSGLEVLAWADRAGVPTVFFASPYRPWPGNWRNLLVWDKGPAVGRGGDPHKCYKRTWELIQVTRNGRLRNGRRAAVIREHTRPDTFIFHPAQKPLALLRTLICDMSDEGQTVLDTFAGSGSTLVAAKADGRKAVGIEIEERYCEVAAKRLSQGTLF